MDDPHLQSAARALARSRRLVVFTGAGVSKESGIATFREPETGLWAQYDPMELATPEAYDRDPAFVWSWYEHRFGAAAAAEPNPGHQAIAELERLLPRVAVITQNIDGLHQRAGSSDVVELHGSMHRFKCVPGTHTGFALADFAEQADKPPRCPECGEYLRPDVVWFGEALSPVTWKAASRAAEECAVLFVVGTSSVVAPASSLALLAARSGAYVFEINPEETPLAPLAAGVFRARAAEVLPAIAAELVRRIP